MAKPALVEEPEDDLEKDEPANDDAAILDEAKEDYDRAVDNETDNRTAELDDIKFAKLEEQWPEGVAKQRALDGRPMLTINKLGAFIRQVVNDSRQNKPAITVHPVDDTADPETAEIYNGLIRNIEVTSKADLAYDTAVDCAVTSGRGYFRIAIDYACDDTFEQDLLIKAIPNPFSVYGDPDSTALDSSDWNRAFITEVIPERVFERKYKGAEKVDWKDGDYSRLSSPWKDDKGVLVAEYWVREEITRKVLALVSPDGEETKIVAADEVKDQPQEFEGWTVAGERPVKSYKVTQYILTGAEVLEKNDWKGRFIPIIPVYGDEVNVEGKRYFRSLVRSAKDAQRMFNYWRPLALDTPLPTPTGWTTMGAVKVGDELFDEAGRPTRVVGMSLTHLHRDCYRVTFDDGSQIVADAQHPWPVEERLGRLAAGFVWQDRLATTAELTPGKHFIRTPAPLEAPDADLPVHPYLLGVWLGDGASRAPVISQAAEDIEELRGHLKGFGCDVGEARHYADRVPVFTVHGVNACLRDLGVLQNKHIPAAYLRASRQQREWLLQGLMDTDGSISARGQCSFTTTTEKLSAGFGELLRSLGIKAVSTRRTGRVRLWADGRPASEHAPTDQFSFTASSTDDVFRLARKSVIQKRARPEHLRRHKRYAIRSVERVPSVPVKCIAIDAPSHLFLAGPGMVPTHNTTATELVALAPKAPYIGEEGSFVGDDWATANTASHPFLEYKKGAQMPQRQPFTGVPAGALQEALNASDDMKAIIGMYDASLGARSNETSGRAIMARQREGDVATFHFLDNLTRSIRHAGMILIDLIPHVYSSERVVRVLGPEGEPSTVPLKTPVPVKDENGQPKIDPQTRQPITRMFDLGVGKYDLTVKAGPSFTSRREEAANQMVEFIRAYPQAAPLIGDLLAKNLDWPGANEIARRLKAMLPPQIKGEDPQLQQAHQQLQEMQKAIQGAMQEIDKQKAATEAAKADNSADSRKLDQEDRKLDQADRKLNIEADRADTERLKVTEPFMGEEAIQALVLQTIQQLLASPDITPAEPAEEISLPVEEPAITLAEPDMPPMGEMPAQPPEIGQPDPLAPPTADQAEGFGAIIEPQQE